MTATLSPAKKPLAKFARRQRTGLGTIEPGQLYPLPVFLRLAGMSQHAWRSAQAKGMKSHKHGRRSYVFGDDWIAFLRSQSPTNTPTAA